MSSAERLAEIIPAHSDRSANSAEEPERWFRDMLNAWQHFANYVYDGRIFAIHRSGSEFSQRNPGMLSNFLERHAALRFMEKYLMRHDPEEFAIR